MKNIKLSKKFLYQEYIKNKKSAPQIAKEIGYSTVFIYKCLKKYKIKIRTNSEVNKGKNNTMYGIHRFGKVAPNYKNGKSREPYPFKFDNKLKELIRQRDNHTCQICGKSTKKNGRKLDVRHIDYDKNNLDPINLISLCQSCHMQLMEIEIFFKNFLEY